MPTSENQMEINVPENSDSGKNVPNKYNKIINFIQQHFITCIYKNKFKFLGENVDESQQLQNTQNSPIEVDIEVLEIQPLGNNVNLL